MLVLSIFHGKLVDASQTVEEEYIGANKKKVGRFSVFHSLVLHDKEKRKSSNFHPSPRSVSFAGESHEPNEKPFRTQILA